MAEDTEHYTVYYETLTTEELAEMRRKKEHLQRIWAITPEVYDQLRSVLEAVASCYPARMWDVSRGEDECIFCFAKSDRWENLPADAHDPDCYWLLAQTLLKRLPPREEREKDNDQ